ncbi:hypothetical protein C0991_003143 [Blastosporella zonata]|nr:hypothetical protein C0991_003143 [Blastosporella zonata]
MLWFADWGEQAVRAIRHPERYGPRARGRGRMGQSRARGLTRAILDTFPVVKFGDDRTVLDSFAELEPQHTPAKNVGNVNLKESRLGPLDHRYDTTKPKADITIETTEDVEDSQPETYHSSTRTQTTATRPPAQSTSSGDFQGREHHTVDVVPASIGRETCPICITDFEEGDDLRLLPCEVPAPYVEKVIARKLIPAPTLISEMVTDFLALENILSGETTAQVSSDDDGDRDHAAPASNSRNRFSRYLRFAQRRHRRRTEDDATSQPSLAP